MRVLMLRSFVIWEIVPIYGVAVHSGGVYRFQTESNAIEFAKGELDNMDAGLQALRSSSGQLSKVLKPLH